MHVNNQRHGDSVTNEQREGSEQWWLVDAAGSRRANAAPEEQQQEEEGSTSKKREGSLLPGFEPGTLRLTVACSNQLSHRSLASRSAEPPHTVFRPMRACRVIAQRRLLVSTIARRNHSMADLQQPRTPKRQAVAGLETNLHRPDFPATPEQRKQVGASLSLSLSLSLSPVSGLKSANNKH